jgi:hypothetical protein
MSNKNDIITRELDTAEKDIYIEKYKTALKKAQLIQEIKNGLGKEIKTNPNKITIIKKPWYIKLGDIIKKIFTKF